jgi:DNA-binding SARP family transcriptional activator
MNTAIWRLKKALSPYPALHLESFENTICLQTDESVRVDTVSLATQLKLAQENLGRELTIPQEVAGGLSDCARNYRGPFLDGLDAHWALVERERYLNFYVRALMILLHDAGERENYEAALGYGRRILAEDPLRESVQREMMWIYVMNGQRAQAVVQYKDLVTKLDTELGIGPMTETVALFTHILNGISAQTELSPGGFLKGRPLPVLSGAVDRPSVFEAVRESRKSLYRSLSTPNI